jgi:CHASE2 domain-containing sensor protein
VIWSLAGLFCCWILLDIFQLQVTGGIAQSAYDAMVRARLVVAAPDPRIVILDIDEPSLKRMSAEFGRWPWPRDTLASVLDYVEKQAPAAIVWDVLFSDADRLSPGGDAAFDSAVQRSRHSHFPVVRLHGSSDDQSQISRAVLPSLWVPSRTPSPSQGAAATVALIPPALPAVANAPLGYNNGYVDSDGVLRRYRNFETLRDGSTIQSIAMSVLSTVDPPAYAQEVAALDSNASHSNELIAWRRHAEAYPHYAFADVFEAADTAKANPALPSMRGKIVLIGSTAASLHDIHPTPLAAYHPGVDSLATAIDNAVNHRHLFELARWQNALIAIALCVGLAAWVQRWKISSLTPFTFALPAGLLFISYLTLNGSPVFVDLHLSAALAMLFLAILRFWNQLRRDFWCQPTALEREDLALWPLVRNAPWTEEALDRLIDFVEKRLPQARIIVPDVQLHLFQELRWPELAQHAAIVAPQAALSRVYDQCEGQIWRLSQTHGKITPLTGLHRRDSIARLSMQIWSTIESLDSPDSSKKGDK